MKLVQSGRSVLVITLVVSIYGVCIILYHIGPAELVTRFEAGIKISPLLAHSPLLANTSILQNFTGIKEKLISEIITLVKAILLLSVANATSETF